MSWNPNHASGAASPNYGAYTAPNYAVFSSPNYAAGSGHNYAALGAPNYAALGAPNYAALGSPNYAVFSAPNYAAQPGASGAMLLNGALIGPGTGAGGASGTGFAGGYGPVARFEYATPAGLGPLPWILDFANGDGWPPFPLDLRLNPNAFNPPLHWQDQDWDRALRFWTLPFDPQLTEWLQDLNLAAPGVMAARQFAAHHAQWLARDAKNKIKQSALHIEFEKRTAQDRLWQGPEGWTAINNELEELADLMRDDRMRYLEEAAVQSGHATPYFVHLMGFDPADKPWTMELMNCASAVGNLVKMQYKAHYKRLRPSALCPGLVPPWGPPRHPAFPSGHATVAHLTALFLLSVPGIAQRFGVVATDKPGQAGTVPCIDDHFANSLSYGHDQHSTLLWLAWRISKGRERLGLHYPSDSAAGRILAALVWQACGGASLSPSSKHKPATAPWLPNGGFRLSALDSVLAHACAEWPELPTG